MCHALKKFSLERIPTLLAGLINARVTHATFATAGVNKLNDYRLIHLVNIQKSIEIRRTCFKCQPDRRVVKLTF